MGNTCFRCRIIIGTIYVSTLMRELCFVASNMILFLMTFSILIPIIPFMMRWKRRSKKVICLLRKLKEQRVTCALTLRGVEFIFLLVLIVFNSDCCLNIHLILGMSDSDTMFSLLCREIRSSKSTKHQDFSALQRVSLILLSIFAFTCWFFFSCFHDYALS